jgi:hypothetical protein
VRLYLPTFSRVNLKFLKGVLNGEKKLIPINDAKIIQVQLYIELYVSKLYPLALANPDLKPYLSEHDHLRSYDKPNTEVFYKVANTLN